MSSIEHQASRQVQYQIAGAMQFCRLTGVTGYKRSPESGTISPIWLRNSSIKNGRVPKCSETDRGNAMKHREVVAILCYLRSSFFIGKLKRSSPLFKKCYRESMLNSGGLANGNRTRLDGYFLTSYLGYIYTWVAGLVAPRARICKCQVRYLQASYRLNLYRGKTSSTAGIVAVITRGKL